LAGLFMIIQRVSGKAQVKFLVAGLGWAFAEFVFTRVIFLWVGARGIEFDWKFVRESLDANVSLVHFLTLACLVWLWSRRDFQHGQQKQALVAALAILIVLVAYRNLAVSAAAAMLDLGPWSALGYRAAAALGLALLTTQIYVGVTPADLKY